MMVWLPRRRFFKRLFFACTGQFWIKKSLKLRILYGTSYIMFFIICVLFILIPIIFRSSYALQRGFVFLNFAKLPINPEYKNPLKYGLNYTRNFFVTTDQDVKLGVWHILPRSLSNEELSLDELSCNKALGNGDPIVLYMHGNSGTRATAHRIELYNILRDLDYHVIAFDYRSYADSSPIAPSEEGVVSDAMFMVKWVMKHSEKSPIFVWGHSLGTGVSSHALALLAQENISSRGLILEAPFNNLRDEIIEHPLARFFKFLPWFEFFIVDPMTDNKLLFQSDKHLATFDSPVLILHAKDDLIVPFHLGKRLYDTCVHLRKGIKNIDFVEFAKELKFGHKYICRSPLLPSIVRKFVTSHTK